MQWLIDNKEWLFSGIGVLFMSVAFTLSFRKKQGVSQASTGRDGNINVQSSPGANISVAYADKTKPIKTEDNIKNPHEKFVGNMVDFVEGVSSDDPLEVSLAVDEFGKIILFYTHTFKVHLKRIEFFSNEKRLVFISDGEGMRYFGMPLDEKLSNCLKNVDTVLLVKLDKKSNNVFESGVVAFKRYD